VRFWDTSAILPLLVEEAASGAVRLTLEDDLRMAAWWGTRVECVSALARRERDGSADLRAVGEALDRLDALAGAWVEIRPTDTLRETAERVLRTHPVRAADALQLAAAIVVAAGNPASLSLVTLDMRLALAASKEGFRVLQPD
jgi:hypothetical protein